MRVLFLDHEQYGDFENEPGNLELRLPMLASGAVDDYQDYHYQRFQRQTSFDNMIEGLFETARAYQLDLIVNGTTWPHESIPPGHLIDLEKLGFPVLTIFWDTLANPEKARQFEYPVFHASRYFCDGGSFLCYARYRLWAERMKLEKGVALLTGHTVMEENFRPDGRPRDIDVALIGSLYENRIELMNYLNAALADRGIRVEHFGGHFDVTKNHPYAGGSGGFLDADAYLDVIRRSKIILCPWGQTGGTGVRGKTFEFMSCEAFCLVERTPDVAHPVPWTQVCLTRRA